jgi:putative membrane protein
MHSDDGRQAKSDAGFWGEIFTLHGSVTPIVFGRVLWFGIIAAGFTLLNEFVEPHLGLNLGPYEVAGAVLGFLLVFRINAGYDRWYEGRKLFGQLVNYSRNLAVTALEHGPDDPVWRESTLRWIAAFGHVSRASLRREGLPHEVRRLLGDQWSAELAAAPHMPTYVALRIGEFMRQAVAQMGMNPLGFLEADRERAWLVECEGSLERIRNTPVPKAYSINVRRLIFLYLVFVPFALLDHLRDVEWLTPLLMMLIAYFVLAIDQLGVELERPFDVRSLNHLPLDDLSARIESEVLGLLSCSRRESESRSTP